MSDDLVARLRNLDKQLVEDEDAPDFSCVEEAVDEIKKLRKERDEARRMYLASSCGDDEEIIAEMRRKGWDCFKEVKP